MEVSPIEEEAGILRDAVGTLHRPAQGNVRIVSLVPSLTELVCALGLGDRLVGRTGFCIHPRAALRAVPKVGGTKDVKLEALRALEPTHVVVNIDENRRETVDALAEFVPNVIVTHPCAPQDNFALYRLFGEIFDCGAAARRLASGLEDALGEAREVAAARPREHVLYLIWREPWMTVARDTYISATLAAVGWDTEPAESVRRYPEVDWRAPWMSRVARVFLSTEPYRFRDRHFAEVEALAGRPARLIDGGAASWYGSRVIPGLRHLAALRRRLSGGA